MFEMRWLLEINIMLDKYIAHVLNWLYTWIGAENSKRLTYSVQSGHQWC